MKITVAQWIVLGALAGSCQSNSSSHVESAKPKTSDHCQHEKCEEKFSVEKVCAQEEATNAIVQQQENVEPAKDEKVQEKEAPAEGSSGSDQQSSDTSNTTTMKESKPVSLLSSDEEASILSSVLGIISETSNSSSDLTAELLELEMEAATLEMQQEMIVP